MGADERDAALLWTSVGRAAGPSVEARHVRGSARRQDGEEGEVQARQSGDRRQRRDRARIDPRGPLPHGGKRADRGHSRSGGRGVGDRRDRRDAEHAAGRRREAEANRGNTRRGVHEDEVRRPGRRSAVAAVIRRPVRRDARVRKPGRGRVRRRTVARGRVTQRASGARAERGPRRIAGRFAKAASGADARHRDAGDADRAPRIERASVGLAGSWLRRGGGRRRAGAARGREGGAGEAKSGGDQEALRHGCGC